MKSIIFVLFLLTLFGRQTPSEPKVLDVFDSNNAELEFESIELVPLETQPDVLVGDFQQLETDLRGDEIYIVNGSAQSGIFRFNLKGEYLNSVGKRGGGPQEFARAVDITVHGDTVDVFAGYGDQVNILGYKKDGTFLYSKTINLKAFSFEWISPGYIVETSYSAVYPFRVYTTSESGEIIDSLLPNTTGFPMVIAENNFSRLGNKVFRHEANRNVVYALENQEFFPTFEINLGAFRTPDDFFERDPVEAVQMLQNRAFAGLIDYFETPSFAYFQIRQRPDPNSGEATEYNVVFDKKDDKLNVRSFPLQSDDFFKHAVSGTEDDEIVFLIYPYMILGDRAAFEQLPLSNPEVIDNLELNDNPVLAICKIR